MHRVQQSWLHTAVKPYFEKKGIKLLRDDLLFIEKCLVNIPQERHRYVMRDYLAIWSATIEGNNLNKENALNPRYEANVYLRSTAGLKGSD